MQVNKEVFNLVGLVDKVVKSFDKQFDVKGNKLFFDFDLSKQLLVSSDEQLLAQVLIQLLSNVNKFTENGMISLGVDIVGNNCCIKIKDT